MTLTTSTQIVAAAQGLVIFTAMRAGMWNSGGSGILVARRPDGGWSAPSAILLHSAALEFLVAVDIYDCVIVANTRSALESLRSSRCTLLPDHGAAVGPVVEDGEYIAVDEPLPPMWTYLKKRGYYVDAPIDGAVITERAGENERFYGGRLGVGDILARKPKQSSGDVKALIETIKFAQGDRNADERSMPTEPSPGHVPFERPDRIFGMPDGDDPDPFGVRALVLEGIDIREAGSKTRPSSEQFEYRPSPTSPIFQTFQHRRSLSSLSGRARDSYSRRRCSVDRSVQMMDTATQTAPSSMDDLQEVDEHHLTESPLNIDGEPKTMVDVDAVLDEGLTDEPVEIHEEEVQAKAAPRTITKARLITISKKLPPPLPSRSPARRKLVINSREAVDFHVHRNGLSTPSASPVSEGSGVDRDQPGEAPKFVPNGVMYLYTPPASPEQDEPSRMGSIDEAFVTGEAEDSTSAVVEGMAILTGASKTAAVQSEAADDLPCPVQGLGIRLGNPSPAHVYAEQEKRAASTTTTTTTTMTDSGTQA